MTDEAEQFILADAASAAAEEPPRRRGIFGRRRSKLPAKPLTHCENCEAPLTGEFCAKCGQHAIDYRRSIFRVVLDAADSFLNWDTKFLQTLNMLLLRPWKLTNDFNAGRRARYVHPLRLYLLASVVFFLVARALNLQSPGPIELTAQDREELVASLGKLTAPDSPLSPEQREKVEAARTKLSEGQGVLTEQERGELKTVFKDFLKSTFRKKLEPGERAKIASAIARIPEPPDPVMETKPGDPPADPAAAVNPPAPPPPADPAAPSVSPAPPKKKKKHDPIHFTMGPEDGTKTPFEAWMEKQIKEKIGEDGSNAKLFLDTLRNNIPVMMLCCIPLFAFVLKVLYIRKRRFYVEHLVYALHIHTFLYVAVVITALGAMAANRTLPALSGWFIGLMSCAIFVQIFLSIRRVYGQGWFFTTLKFALGGVVYLVILATAVAATAFVTLLLP
ncbi:MAG TPA: DUF3667 domain-containing protein [Chthoniobacterales bacterium]|nr:DUF3667 domain-containing protein [Chthoniobacterales bacterium]